MSRLNIVYVGAETRATTSIETCDCVSLLNAHAHSCTAHSPHKPIQLQFIP